MVGWVGREGEDAVVGVAGAGDGEGAGAGEGDDVKDIAVLRRPVGGIHAGVGVERAEGGFCVDGGTERSGLGEGQRGEGSLAAADPAPPPPSVPAAGVSLAAPLLGVLNSLSLARASPEDTQDTRVLRGVHVC